MTVQFKYFKFHTWPAAHKAVLDKDFVMIIFILSSFHPS